LQEAVSQKPEFANRGKLTWQTGKLIFRKATGQGLSGLVSLWSREQNDENSDRENYRGKTALDKPWKSPIRRI
jgi:hypothetical protein